MGCDVSTFRFKLWLAAALLGWAAFLSPFPAMDPARGETHRSPAGLTPAEEAWLRRHGEIRVGVGVAFPPVQYIDDTGRFQGIAADYLALLEERTGLNLRVVKGITWPEVLGRARRREIDVLACAAVTPDRETYMAFTRPYLVIPYVIVTRKDAPYVGTLGDLAGGRVAAVRGLVTQELLQRDHPRIRLYLVDATREALRSVSLGRADAYVGSLLVASHLIQMESLGNLKVAAPAGYNDTALCMGVRNDWPELLSILEKSLALVSPQEHQEIRRRWIRVRYEHGIDTDYLRTVAVRFVLIFAGMALAVYFWHRQIRIREERFRGLTENGMDLTQAFRPEGTILYQSPSHLPMLGYGEGTLVGTSVFALIHPDDRDAFRGILRRLEREGGAERFVHRIRRKDGVHRYFESNCINLLDNRSLGAMVLNARDITDRRLAEENLRASEATLRAVFDGVNVAIFLHDADGTVLDVNERMLSMYGVTREEARRMSIADDFSAPENPVHQLPDIWAAVLAGEPRNFEWRARRPRDGGLFPVEVFLRKVYVRDAFVILASIHDTTEREEAERQMRAAKEAAESANRAKNEFLANMSHELRTPLNGILGYTQILKREGGMTERQAGAVEIIHRCGEHLLTMINDILDLSKIEARRIELKPVDFNLVGFLENLAAVHVNQARSRGVRFSHRFSGDLPLVVTGDETRLRQVLLNLLGNALKFAGAGEVLLEAGRAGNRVRFDITDTGAGIPPEELESIFLPFHQGSAEELKVEGTGLGLAISRRLVELMGGRLRVESRVGEGSRFWFAVPLKEVVGFRAPAEGRSDAFRGRVDGAGKTVLVVDDVWANRRVLVDMVNPMGFRIVEAADGREAVEKARRTRPDLVLMDLVLPRMGGIEATRRIREIPDLENVPVIAVSASISGEIRSECEAAGCSAFLAKPLEAEALTEVLEAHLGPARPGGAVPPSPASGGGPPPPPDRRVLESLATLARAGDVMAVRKIAEQILAAGGESAEFGGRLLPLAKGLHVKKIRAFLARYLTENMKDGGH